MTSITHIFVCRHLQSFQQLLIPIIEAHKIQCHERLISFHDLTHTTFFYLYLVNKKSKSKLLVPLTINKNHGFSYCQIKSKGISQ